MTASILETSWTAYFSRGPGTPAVQKIGTGHVVRVVDVAHGDESVGMLLQREP